MFQKVLDIVDIFSNPTAHGMPTRSIYVFFAQFCQDAIAVIYQVKAKPAGNMPVTENGSTCYNFMGLQVIEYNPKRKDFSVSCG
jgi:hypothetical protein